MGCALRDLPVHLGDRFGSSMNPRHVGVKESLK
jgi:hypothetical protein